ncbi:MAG: adenosine kinase [Proteobacteria bacterium]|nr:MAG: adenosine kinase [Pseudomonadota bacterium]
MAYHVYGIGNALVDMEFEVADTFLQENGIEKGLMTLIDESQQQQLSNSLTSTYQLAKRTGGGSAANTIVAISELGGNAFYACKVADDEGGEFYMNDLHQAGVTTRLDQMKHTGVTGKCMVMVTPDAERTMNTFLGITTDFSVNELHFEDLKQAEYIYAEGYLVTSDVSRAAVLEARKVAAANSVKTAFTFSDPSMVTYFRDGVAEIIGDGVDILFSNQEEATIFTGEENLDDAIAELQKLCSTLVLTLGSQGAMVIKGDERIMVEPVPTKAIDTNGAGDMFAGAFMYGITHGFSELKAGNLASEAASIIVSRFGTRLEASEKQYLTDKYC